MGSAGPQGSQGAPGPMGAAGSPGIAGATGATGPGGNTGATGVAGPAGAQGLPGVAGATGPQGVVGATGVAGPVGLAFQGAYSSSTNYSRGAGVLWQGAGWVSLRDSNLGNVPDGSPSAWSMFAAPGSSGATGATGVGLTGATGAAGAPGATGSVGALGATGATGAAGLRFLGPYSSATGYVTGDAVSYNGASYVSLTENNHGTAAGCVARGVGAAGSPGKRGLGGCGRGHRSNGGSGCNRGRRGGGVCRRPGRYRRARSRRAHISERPGTRAHATAQTTL